MRGRDPNKLFLHDRLMRPLVALIPAFVMPNHLTVLRFVLTPFVLGLLFVQQYRIGVPLFIFAAFTDALDGTLARLRRQITDWGTFYDPIADKLLIAPVLFIIAFKHVNPYVIGGLILIEITIALGGWFRRKRGRMNMANGWGKWKMILEFIGITFLLLALWLGLDPFIQFAEVTLVLAAIFAFISLVTYSL